MPEACSLPPSTGGVWRWRLSVAGQVSHAEILAGYDRTGAAVNGDVRIGAVTIARDWIASSLVAGVTAGTEGSGLIAGGSPAVVARIASIFIKGSISGSDGAGDSFSFVVEEIDFFQAAGVKLPLTRGAGNVFTGLLGGTSGGGVVREVA